MMHKTKHCEYCGSEFSKPYFCSKKDWIVRRFCKRECFHKASRSWLNGRKFKQETLKKMSIARLGNPTRICGEDHAKWKGDKVSYSALHSWVIRQKGPAKKCNRCGITSGERKIQWANKSHEYKRDISDFFGLCPSCHKLYDLAYSKSHA